MRDPYLETILDPPPFLQRPQTTGEGTPVGPLSRIPSLWGGSLKVFVARNLWVSRNQSVPRNLWR